MSKLCMFMMGLLISLGFVSTALAHDVGDHHEIILLGKSSTPTKSTGNRFIYKLNGVFVVVSPGDLIDRCMVNRVGQLACNNKEESDFLATTLEEKQDEIVALYSELTVLNHQYEALKNDETRYQDGLGNLNGQRDEQLVLITKLREIATKQAHQLSTIRHVMKQSINNSLAQNR